MFEYPDRSDGNRDLEAAHEEHRARGVDTDAEVLRLGEGVPAAMFTFRDRGGTRYRVVERDRNRRGQAAAVGRGGLSIYETCRLSIGRGA